MEINSKWFTKICLVHINLNILNLTLSQFIIKVICSAEEEEDHLLPCGAIPSSLSIILRVKFQLQVAHPHTITSTSFIINSSITMFLQLLVFLIQPLWDLIINKILLITTLSLSLLLSLTISHLKKQNLKNFQKLLCITSLQIPQFLNIKWTTALPIKLKLFFVVELEVQEEDIKKIRELNILLNGSFPCH